MSKHHFDALDGLRGVAAISVMLFHLRSLGPGGHLLDQGYLAVGFFFVLSGFVIDYAYAARFGAGLTFSRFAVLRLIRLYPMILLGAVTGTAYLAVLALHHGDHAAIPKVIVAGALAALCLPAPPWLVDQPFLVNGPMWSLFFELIANVAYGLVLYRLGLSRLLLALLGLACASVVMAVETQGMLPGHQHRDLPWGIVSVLTPFTLGVVLNRVRGRLTLPALGFGPASALLVLSFAPTAMGRYGGLYAAAMVLLAYPLLIACAQRAEPSGRWRRIAAWSGFVSYPLYALHYPVLEFASGALDHSGTPALLQVALLSATALLVATVAARAIDEPVRAWLTRLSQRRSGKPAQRPSGDGGVPPPEPPQGALRSTPANARIDTPAAPPLAAWIAQARLARETRAGAARRRDR